MVWVSEVAPTVNGSVVANAGCATSAGNDHFSHESNYNRTMVYDGIAWSNDGGSADHNSYYHACGGSSAGLICGGGSGGGIDKSALWSGSSWALGPTMPHRTAYGAMAGSTADAFSLGAADSAYQYGGTMRFNGTTWSTGPSAFGSRNRFFELSGSATSAIYTGGDDPYDSDSNDNDDCRTFNGTAWTTQTAMPQKREYHMGWGLSDFAYVACGENEIGVTLDNTHKWNGTAWVAEATALFTSYGGQSGANGPKAFMGYGHNTKPWSSWTLDLSFTCLTGEILMETPLTGAEGNAVYKDLAWPHIVSVVPSQFLWGAAVRINTKNIAVTSGRDVWIGGVLQTVTGTGTDYVDFTCVQGTLLADTDTYVTLAGTYTKGAYEVDWVENELFLECQGLDNGVIFTDTGFDPKTILVGGGVITDTAKFKFGTSSAYFPGSAGEYLNIRGTANLIRFNEPFTLEGWIYLENLDNARRPLFCHQSGATGGAIMWELDMGGTNDRMNLTFGNTSTSGAYLAESATTGSATELHDLWAHVALCRNSAGVWSAFQKGRLVIRGTESSTVAGTTSDLLIGRWDGSAQQQFGGWMTHMRAFRGVDKYYDDFVPPTTYYKSRTA